MKIPEASLAMPVIANWKTDMHYNNTAILIISFVFQLVRQQLGIGLLSKATVSYGSTIKPYSLSKNLSNGGMVSDRPFLFLVAATTPPVFVLGS